MDGERGRLVGVRGWELSTTAVDGVFFFFDLGKVSSLDYGKSSWLLMLLWFDLSTATFSGTLASFIPGSLERRCIPLAGLIKSFLQPHEEALFVFIQD